MFRKSLVSVCFLLGLLTAAPFARCDELEAPLMPYSGLSLDLERLKTMHEGVLWMLKTYSAVEATVSARINGMDDTKVFWTGVSSWVLPGAGQFINHDSLQGTLLMSMAMVSWVTYSELPEPKYAEHRPRADMLAGYYFARFVRESVMVTAMIQAADTAYELHPDRTQATWVGISSAVIPGVGQAINHEWSQAAGCFLLWAMAAAATTSLEEQRPLRANETSTQKQDLDARWAMAWLADGPRLQVSWNW